MDSSEIVGNNHLQSKQGVQVPKAICYHIPLFLEGRHFVQDIPTVQQIQQITDFPIRAHFQADLSLTIEARYLPYQRNEKNQSHHATVNKIDKKYNDPRQSQYSERSKNDKKRGWVTQGADRRQPVEYRTIHRCMRSTGE